MRIAFFDSGLGGLTVLSAAMRELPQEDFLFFADTLHVPYGTKAKEDVKSYIHDAIKTIMQEEVKAIVIACNTATSMAISELRRTYPIPIIGMEPAVKPAVEINRSSGKRILVFATPLTLRESKYRDLVRRVDSMHIVDSLPLPELVEYCEALNFDQKIMNAYFTEKLDGFDLNEYGTVVLGCTHYPFYKKILSDLLPEHIQIIDGSTGTVNRLIQVLRANDLLSSSGTQDVRQLNSSQSMEYAEKMGKALSIYREIENRQQGYPERN
ncbi:glutamate racemase [Paenibacillus glucanolyticus]|jgi:glutamate racemase|uniref:glutamate racemase n=1 Tax=Paenibacillus TaxID=44249 RepID=UPI0004AFB275|nr:MULTISPECIES: glutamate racemase [Paenibacillus]ANA78586.1 glutamate racemase [Paenibacillus glucanolyticus]AVV57498.1 glutamate racemase [Paenibacillus glucanolyticus]